jgi:hypothetical protein
MARWTRLAGVALAGFAALGANTGASNNLFVVTAAGDFGGASEVATLPLRAHRPTTDSKATNIQGERRS